jgi:hypothetical protein
MLIGAIIHRVGGSCGMVVALVAGKGKLSKTLLFCLERMGVLTPHLGTPFHADSNELFFVSRALTLIEILVDYDGT